MEVSGRKDTEKQILKAGDRRGDILCQPCQGEDENVPAVSYCETCNVFICSSCLRAHRKLPITKNHVIKSKDEMLRTHVQTDPCTELCTMHKTEIVKFYCQSHDEVGCGDCMVVHHKACKVDLVQDVSGIYSSSEELKQIKHHIEQLVKEITFRQHDIKCNLVAAAEMNLKIVEEIKNFRKDINIYLDSAETELLNEVEHLRKSDVSLQNKLQDECDSMQKEMEEHQRTFHRNSQKINQLFVSAKAAQKKMKICQEYVDRIATECQIHIYKFEPAKSLMTLKVNQPILGSVSIQNKENTGPRQSKKSIEPYQSKRSMVDMKAEFVKKLNVQSANEEACGITGLAMISSDEIILADCHNKAVKILNVRKNKISSSYKLSAEPWDMTVTSPGKVAVTVPQKHRILFMHTQNRLSESHSLKVRGSCYGIDHKDGVLAVSFCFPPAVQILDMNGDVLHEISDTRKIRFPLYIALSNDSESIFVSDNGMNTVYELALDGQLKASTQHGKWINPRGLAVTGDGTVIVCCEGIPGNVCMIVSNTKEVIPLSINDTSMFRVPFYTALSHDSKSIYVSDRVMNTVYEQALDGQLKASTQWGEWSDPTGLAVTGDGTVIVCCREIPESMSMIVCNTREVIPLSIKDVKRPQSILVCEEQNKMFISDENDRNNITVFDMK